MRRAIAGLIAAGACAAAGAAAPTAFAAPPAGMQYELVSPHASRGFDFTRAWLLPDGDRALIGSELSDINGVYPVRRTADGWQQLGRRSLSPPIGEPLVAAGTAAISQDGSRVLVSAVRRNPGPDEIVNDTYAINEADGSWTTIGGGLRYIDGSPDLSRLIMGAEWAVSDEDRFPGLPGRETGVYLWEHDGTDDGAPSAIGADQPRLMTCGGQVPDAAYSRALEQTGVSPDARAAVFSSRADCLDPDSGDPLPSHVFHWRDGVTTDVSAPTDGSDGAATFVGHSADLRTLWFRTDEALDAGDANGAADVYRWDEATGRRTRVTGAATDAGETLTTAISSDDGSHLWFATIDGAGEESLWVAARGQAPRRIASATEPDYPQQAAFHLVSQGNGSNMMGFPAQTTPDGETLVFTTRTPIDGVGGSNVPLGNDAGQLFRATPDGDVECLSCLPDGGLADRVTPGGRLDGLLLMNRVVSDDGRWIAFQTPTALTDDDANDLDDVYVWHDGEVSLVSGGLDGFEGRLANVDAAGNVMFKSYAALLPWIEDDHLKVYVARQGGGFPAPPDPRQTCTGDGCQGPSGPRGGDPSPPSEGFRGPGDRDDPAPSFPAKPSLSVGRPSAAAKRTLARGRAATLTVRSNTRGRVSATVSFKRGRRWVKSGTSARSIRAGRAVRVTVRLSRAARAQLARRGALRVRIEVSHGQVGSTRRIAFVLKRQAPTRRGARA